MKTVTLNIAGMTCSGCVNAVENALTAVEGTGTVSVSLPEGKAAAEFDENRTSAGALKAAVEDAGYDVSIALE